MASDKPNSVWTTGLGRRGRKLEFDYPVQPWMIVLVYAFLLILVLRTFVLFSAQEDDLAVIWIQPSSVGVSLSSILVAINLSLLLVLVGATLFRPLVRTGWKNRPRIASLAFAFLLLGGAQLEVAGWTRFANFYLEMAIADRAKAEERIALIEEELVGLDDHPWAGRYVAAFEGSSDVAHFWFAPESGCASTWFDSEYEEGAHPAERANLSSHGAYELESEALGVRILDRRILYIPADWGERRYLVWDRYVDDFKTAARQGESDIRRGFGLLLRVEDREKPVFGTPQFPPGY